MIYIFKIQEFVTSSTRRVIEHSIILKRNIFAGGGNNQSSNLCPAFFGQSARGIHWRADHDNDSWLLNAIQQGILTKSTKTRLEENAIYLYDDRMLITYNFKDGTKRITFEDINQELSGERTGSDIECLGAPERHASACLFFGRTRTERRPSADGCVGAQPPQAALGTETSGHRHQSKTIRTCSWLEMGSDFLFSSSDLKRLTSATESSNVRDPNPEVRYSWNHRIFVKAQDVIKILSLGTSKN